MQGNDELRDPYALPTGAIKLPPSTADAAPPSLPPGFGRKGTHHQAVAMMNNAQQSGLYVLYTLIRQYRDVAS